MEIEGNSGPSFYMIESMQDYLEYKRLHVEETNLVSFDDIIHYLEELPPERMEDGKSIQLMLYEIAGSRCSEEQYERISNAWKKNTTLPSVTYVLPGSQYVETLNNQNNNYGRK